MQDSVPVTVSGESKSTIWTGCGINHMDQI
jgi:hypothetical protein